MRSQPCIVNSCRATDVDAGIRRAFEWTRNSIHSKSETPHRQTRNDLQKTFANPYPADIQTPPKNMKRNAPTTAAPKPLRGKKTWREKLADDKDLPRS